MAYFKINNVDFSTYCNKLNVRRSVIYNSQTNAGGHTVVDVVNAKRVIEAGIIPLKDDVMRQLKAELDKFTVSISFLNPTTGALETIDCIIPESNIEYYTIQADNVMFNGLELSFEELKGERVE